MKVVRVLVSALACAPFLAACDTPHTNVVLENNYAPSTRPLVVYHASWQAISFQDDGGVPPGAASDTQVTVPASENLAFVVLAPGWDRDSSKPPTSFVVMRSRHGFAVHLDTTLHISVDDTTFLGNCAAGSFLTQAQADFITQLVFPTDFATFKYDPATCTVTPLGEAGAP